MVILVGGRKTKDNCVSKGINVAAIDWDQEWKAGLRVHFKPIFDDGLVKRGRITGQRSRHPDASVNEAGISLPCSHRATPSNVIVWSLTIQQISPGA